MAVKLFTAAGLDFLLGLVSLALSGGGLARGPLPEPISSVFVVVTWLAWLALVPLIVAACVAAVLTITSPRARPSETEEGWPTAQAFSGIAPGANPSSDPEPQPAVSSRNRGALVVLLLLTVGGVSLFVRSAQRPSGDDVPIGLALLGFGLVALIIIVSLRIVRFVRGLLVRRAMS